MIQLYPVKIEAHEDGEPVFTVEAFDDFSATLRIDALVNEAMLPALFVAITKAVMMMKLKTGADE